MAGSQLEVFGVAGHEPAVCKRLAPLLGGFLGGDGGGVRGPPAVHPFFSAVAFPRRHRDATAVGNELALLNWEALCAEYEPFDIVRRVIGKACMIVRAVRERVIGHQSSHKIRV